MSTLRSSLIIVAFLVPVAASAQSKPDGSLPELTEATVKSSLDSESQPVRFWAPDQAREEPTPLLVFLHSWSGDYRQDNSKWQAQAVKRGWIYLHPNFRGVNQTPKACGSKWARQDILDAVDFAMAKFNVDPKRIYLAGTSGGGHMAMLMAGHHPDRFSAVSAWVGISDLAAWYTFHLKDGQPQRYARMILASLGGAPGSNRSIDADYKDRSPIHHLHRAVDLPLQICAGINDGHTGSVPITHSLDAFNVIARAHKDEVISDAIISSLSQRHPVKSSKPSDADELSAFGRSIVFQKTSEPCSVVIFEGGHEGLPDPACDWLSVQTRSVVVTP
ncbi:MAG: prolyl oligopeptidase family serine peptidase [Rhodopirellula sp.]|nr:prolyl oligopeptidase family serine peptidase [Rhodopirellula sp.]